MDTKPSNRPSISVIIPVYNAEKYLRCCLDSIFSANEGQMLEVIAIDDGSTDGSREILEEYARDKGLIVLRQTNTGAAGARNAGLDIASGEYVAFVDSDDWVEQNMYRKMYESAKETKADIVFCNIYRNENERMRKYLPSGVYDRDAILTRIYPLLISNLNEKSGQVTLRGATWPRIFRRELIEDYHIRYDDKLVYNEDALFCIHATLCCNTYVYLGDDYLYHNRYTPGSITKRYITDLWPRQKSLIPKLWDLTRGEQYDFTAQIYKKAMDVAIYCIENECKAGNSGNRAEIKNTIAGIVKDADIQDAVKHIDVHLLKKINRMYWVAFKLKSGRLAEIVARVRMRRFDKERR